MANLADLSDTSSLAPCKRCGELLHEHARICPECGKDQSIADEAGDPSVALNSVRGALVEGQALAPFKSDTAVLTFDQVQQAMIQELVPPPPQEQFGTSIGFLRPGAFWHPEAETAVNDRTAHWAERSVAPNRIVLGVLAALVVLLGVALAYEAYTSWQREEGRQQAFRANIEQMQVALQRGDLGAAERALGALMLDHPEDPAVADLRNTLERQTRDRAAQLELSRKAERAAASTPAPAAPTRGASRVLALSESAPAPDKAAASAPADAPAAAVPVSLPAAPPPPKMACSGALAALALCQRN